MLDFFSAHSIFYLRIHPIEPLPHRRLRGERSLSASYLWCGCISFALPHWHLSCRSRSNTNSNSLWYSHAHPDSYSDFHINSDAEFSCNLNTNHTDLSANWSTSNTNMACSEPPPNHTPFSRVSTLQSLFRLPSCLSFHFSCLISHVSSSTSKLIFCQTLMAVVSVAYNYKSVRWTRRFLLVITLD